MRTLNLQAGTGVAPKAATPAAAEAAVCNFPAGLICESERFPCDFAVMGSINGKVALSGQSKLVIAAGGKVEGEIVSKSISIDGEANGKIDASGGLDSFGENAICTGSIQYTLGHWSALTHYLEDRAVAIDNNHLERQIKP